MLVLHAFLLHVPFWVLFQQMQWMYRYNDMNKHDFIKRCGIGPLLVLVSPCFRENVVVTCKIGSFLCSLDNLLQKNVFVSFLKIKFQNGTHLKKKRGLFLIYFSHFLVTREKLQKFLQHISLSHTYMIHVFCSPYWLFCLINFEKKK